MHTPELTQQQIDYLRGLVAETQEAATDPKLKPFCCKQCGATLGHTSGKVFKSTLMVVTHAQSIVITCQICGTSRRWKPCESKV